MQIFKKSHYFLTLTHLESGSQHIQLSRTHLTIPNLLHPSSVLQGYSSWNTTYNYSITDGPNIFIYSKIIQKPFSKTWGVTSMQPVLLWTWKIINKWSYFQYGVRMHIGLNILIQRMSYEEKKGIFWQSQAKIQNTVPCLPACKHYGETRQSLGQTSYSWLFTQANFE